MVYSRQFILKSVIYIGLGLLFNLSVAQADNLMPEVPRGKGDQCVEPTADMRKNHMKFILHQRDETMHKGIRTSKHSLKECIECHNAPGRDGKVARIGNKEHFCSSCHTYSAVNVDCFECHADKPEKAQYRHTSASKEGSH